MAKFRVGKFLTISPGQMWSLVMSKMKVTYSIDFLAYVANPYYHMRMVCLFFF